MSLLRSRGDVLFCCFLNGVFMSIESGEGGKLCCPLHHCHARMMLRGRMLKVDDIVVVIIHNSQFIIHNCFIRFAR